MDYEGGNLNPGRSKQDRSVAVSAELTGVDLLDSVKLRLAEQYAPRAWRSWIGSVAKQIESGSSFDLATKQLRPTAPAELWAIVESAQVVGDPSQLILDAIRVRESFRESWRKLWLLFIYPVVMLVFTIAIGIIFTNLMDFAFLDTFGLQGVAEILATIEDLRHSVVGFAFIVGWTLVSLGTISLLGPSWAWTAIIGGIRIFGRPLRWISLSEILHRYQLFINQGLPTAVAASAVSKSFASSSQRFSAEGIEHRIIQGMPIGKAFAESSLTDALCRPALHLLDMQTEDLSAALSDSYQLLQHLAVQRCNSLGNVMPLLVILMVGSLVWSIISCYFLALVPLVSMITSLA